MLLMIDNYDSFTYNLVQYFGEAQTGPAARNDKITISQIKEKNEHKDSSLVSSPEVEILEKFLMKK